MNLDVLKTELATDPAGLGYANKSDSEIAALLNARDRTAPRDTIDGGTLAAAIVVAEYAALSAAQRGYVDLVCGQASIPWTNNLKTELARLFGEGTQTRANFVALQSKTASRAEQLGLPVILPGHLEQTRLEAAAAKAEALKKTEN